MSDEAIPGGLNEDDFAALTTPTADYSNDGSRRATLCSD
jgi:hypothetical protein